MVRTVGFSTGINLIAGFGTGSNDRLMPIPNYSEAYLQTVVAFPSANNRGPIWGWFVLRTGQTLFALGQPGWFRSDANFAGSDPLRWEGSIQLADTGGNEVIPLFRNDWGTNTIITVACSIRVVKD